MLSGPGARRRLVRWLQARSPLGLVLAVVLLHATLGPSLLARSWVFQGVLSGVGLAVGYGLGAALGAAGTRLLVAAGGRPPPTDPTRRVLLGAAVLVAAVLGVLGAAEQHRWTWDRLGYDPDLSVSVYLAALTLAGATLLVLLALAWLVRAAHRRVTSWGARWLPTWVAAALALVLVLWSLLAATNAWVLQRTLEGMNVAFSYEDLQVSTTTPQPPAGSSRSGSPDSLLDWSETGHEGRRFLTAGPSVRDIAELSPGGPAAAREPVRVFVGRASAEDVAGRVRLAMAELERLDGFTRRAIHVVVPTGTGWVNEQIVSPPEHLLDGDVATVSVQYSHLPSPLAHLAEQEGAGETGRQLVAEVRERLEALPEARRPQLLVAGESLGSYGAAEAFEDLDDLLTATDRSLWVGPPEFMHLRRQAEQDRVAGSLQIRPVVGDGEDLVFVNRRSDLDGTRPRSVFLQQADDPIVWWDVPTLWDRPDWLGEPLDEAVNPAMTWRPVATFLNLTVDMAVGNDFDEDHGHLYGTQPLAAWAAMLQPPGWDAERVERLRQRLALLVR